MPLFAFINCTETSNWIKTKCNLTQTNQSRNSSINALCGHRKALSSSSHESSRLVMKGVGCRDSDNSIKKEQANTEKAGFKLILLWFKSFNSIFITHIFLQETIIQYSFPKKHLHNYEVYLHVYEFL